MQSFQCTHNRSDFPVDSEDSDSDWDWEASLEGFQRVEAGAGDGDHCGFSFRAAAKESPTYEGDHQGRRMRNAQAASESLPVA